MTIKTLHMSMMMTIGNLTMIHDREERAKAVRYTTAMCTAKDEQIATLFAVECASQWSFRIVDRKRKGGRFRWLYCQMYTLLS